VDVFIQKEVGKWLMKKIIKIFITLILIGIAVFVALLMLHQNKFNYVFEDVSADINELYIYGNHLNLKGTLNTDIQIDKVELILFDKEEFSYELNFNKNENVINFYISSMKNNGILLDKLKKGNYITFLKITSNNEFLYYALINQTEYSKTEYYTIRKDDNFNHILIENGLKDTLNIKVEQSNEENIYDVVIDAGHGGIDPGACYKGTCETDFTLDLSLKLKEKLENYGLKVALTRDETIKNDKVFETYGLDGRIDRAMRSKAKYLFSFHLNSGLSSRTGTEIYTTNNIDYTLARNIVDSIVNNTNTTYSNNPIFKVENGIYTRTFQTYEINDVINEAKEKGYAPYDITTNTTYYYIIRETGGFMTGAYIDGRSENKNLHYNTNVGLESYIFELGYITNPKDTNDIKNNMDDYIDAIGSAIVNNICE